MIPDPTTPPKTALIQQLRAQLAARVPSAGGRARPPVLPFGLAALDDALPDGGLRRGALHEVCGGGPDIEHGAAAALFAAGILARTRGRVLWVMECADLFAPAIAAVGLHPDRVIYAEAGRGAVLQVIEEGLRHPGLAGVVGEIGGRLSLTASRRLLLAAEASGVLAIALRRSRVHDDPQLLRAPTAALTRWQVGAHPSPPALPHAPDTPGLGRPRWRVDLRHCRGGMPASWVMEACDAKGRLRLAADLAHRPAAPAEPGRLARPAAGDVAA